MRNKDTGRHQTGLGSWQEADRRDVALAQQVLTDHDRTRGVGRPDDPNSTIVHTLLDCIVCLRLGLLLDHLQIDAQIRERLTAEQRVVTDKIVVVAIDVLGGEQPAKDHLLVGAIEGYHVAELERARRAVCRRKQQQ